MSRPLRVSYPGAVYHVTERGNERKRIVRDDQDRERFLAIVGDMVEQYQVLCHAWVLMDNHYHLVLETPQANLSVAIRHVNGVYTQAFNRRHQRVGHLFQGRFNAILVQQEAYLLELCRYVVLNPVRAKMATRPNQWRWSSYRATSGEELAPPWLVTEWILEPLAPMARAARRAYVECVGAACSSQRVPGSRCVISCILARGLHPEDAAADWTPDQPGDSCRAASAAQTDHGGGGESGGDSLRGQGRGTDSVHAPA